MFSNWHWQAGIWLSYPCINMTAVPSRLKCSAAFHPPKACFFHRIQFVNYLVTKPFHLRRWAPQAHLPASPLKLDLLSSFCERQAGEAKTPNQGEKKERHTLLCRTFQESEHLLHTLHGQAERDRSGTQFTVSTLGLRSLSLYRHYHTHTHTHTHSAWCFISQCSVNSWRVR